MTERKAVFVIFASENCRDGWQPVKKEELPDWVIHPDNLGRMVNGEMCMRADIGERGSKWYRAEVGLDKLSGERLDAALKARDAREAESLLQLPADKAIFVESSELRH